MLGNTHISAFSHYPGVNHAYSRFRSYGIVRWVVDLAILAFAAAVLARDPTRDLFIASAYTIGAAGLCTVFFVPLVGPRSQTDPRPSFWVAPGLVFTQVALLPAAGLLIQAYTGDGNRYSRRHLSAETASLDKRIYIYPGNVHGTLNQRLALIAGCCCIASVVGGIVQGYYIVKLYGAARSSKMTQNGMVETLE